MKPTKFIARLTARALILGFFVFACSAQTQAQNITVQYATTGDWGSGFQGQITINNGTAQAINGWTLAFDFDRSLNSVYDATVLSHTGTRYTVKNVGFNNTIPAGGSVSFGFTGSPGNVTKPPTNYVLNGISLSRTATTFAYQGRLTDKAATNGVYDLQFALYDDAGTQIGTAQTIEDVTVANGVFSVLLDFGAEAFSGANRSLEIRVRRGSETGAFTTLSPRQPVTPAPYAVTAHNALQLDGKSASSFLQNSNSQQTNTNFNISGNGTVGGALSGSTVNASLQYNLGGGRILSSGGDRNLFAGLESGAVNTGSLNAFFGARAGKSNTTGTWNSFFGADAGLVNTTGDHNSFFGESAGFVNTTGGNNTFVGSGAGFASTTGNYNSFLGARSGFANTTGGENAFIGANTGIANTEGNFNSFFGTATGGSNTIGSHNTIIGHNANVGANNLNFAAAFGANAVVASNDTIVLGKTAGTYFGEARPADTVQIPGTLIVAGAVSAGTITSGCKNGFTAIAGGRLCVSALQPAATFYGSAGATQTCINLGARVGTIADATLSLAGNFNYFGGVSQGWLGDYAGDNLRPTWNVNANGGDFDGSPVNVYNGGQNATAPAYQYRCVY